MHGLIGRAFQCFVTDRHGEDMWRGVAEDAELGFINFEALLIYESEMLTRLITAAARRTGKSEALFMEDAGAYLVSREDRSSLRRLLRFGGETFEDFVHSIDDLPDWAQLALPDLRLPDIQLTEVGEDSFVLTCRSLQTGFCHFAVGVIRAMADDYGVLVTMEAEQVSPLLGYVRLHLLDRAFASARHFELAAEA